MLSKHQGTAHKKPYTVPAKLVLLSELLLLKAVGKYPVLNQFQRTGYSRECCKYPSGMKYFRYSESTVKSFNSYITDNLESKSYS